MYYYRSKAGDRSLTPLAARLTTLGALIAYPAGAVMLGLDEGIPALRFAGFASIILALGLAISIIGTILQRIIGEVPARLDEYELKLRTRAVGAAYKALTAVMLSGVLYAAIASEAGLWIPRGYDAFNAIFWGAFLYATLLPSAILAWQADPADLTGEV